MPHTIHVYADQRYTEWVNVRLLTKTARVALSHQATPEPGALTLQFAGDALLRKLNREFMGQDYATDVLSFPADEMTSTRRYFGDVVISIPRARAQAKAGGHPFVAELQLLVVHGVLHLLGHDHYQRGEKKRMWAAQAEILERLGSILTKPTENS